MDSSFTMPATMGKNREEWTKKRGIAWQRKRRSQKQLVKTAQPPVKSVRSLFLALDKGLSSVTANQKARNPWAHLIASLCATLKHRYFESCSAKKPKSALGHPAGSPKSQDGACAVIFQFWVPIFTAPKNNAKEFGIQMSLWGRSNALLKPNATPNH